MEENYPFDEQELEDFDPLAPIEFEGEEEEDANPEDQEYYVEKVPPIAASIEEAAAARRAKYPVPELTREQKIAKAIKGMPGQKKLLLHIIDWCREEHEDASIIDEIIAFERGSVNTFSPESIIATLVRCEALKQTNAPAPEGEEAKAPQEEAEAIEAAGAEEPVADQEDAPAPENAEEAPQAEYLEVKKPEAARYIATKEGLDAVEAENPAARFEAFMDANPVYAPIFRTILENCDHPEGCTKKQIDALVDHDPICMVPRRFSGYFVDKLEDADAIIFEKTWHTTEIGRRMLEEDGIIGAL
ncbi:MAG: hypothetical protein IKE43_10830 [Coriobacteriales bacterium]|nr:hypothetical protein [Coriobacteriales bacterium]